MAIRESTKNGKTTIEKRYSIYSINADAKLFEKAVRSQLGIESTHWLLDVAMAYFKKILLRIFIY